MKDTNGAGIGHNISISHEELREILDGTKDTQRAVSEANGKHRQGIKTVIEERDWHAKAFGDIRKIDAMSETERADYLRTFKPLFAAMMDAEWEEQLQDLLSDVDDQSDDQPGLGDSDKPDDDTIPDDDDEIPDALEGEGED